MQTGKWLSLHHKHAQNMVLKNLYTYIFRFKDMFRQEKKGKEKMWDKF